MIIQWISVLCNRSDWGGAAVYSITDRLITLCHVVIVLCFICVFTQWFSVLCDRSDGGGRGLLSFPLMLVYDVLTCFICFHVSYVFSHSGLLCYAIGVLRGGCCSECKLSPVERREPLLFGCFCFSQITYHC